MDLFIDFVFGSISTFILAYFIYMIFGRRRKISIFILSFMLIFDLIPVVNAFMESYPLEVTVLIFLSNAGSTIFAFFLFMTFTGGLGISRVRRKKLKNLSTDIQTKRLTEISSVSVIIISIIMALLSHFILEEPNYIILVVSAISFALGIYIFVIVGQIKIEKVILLIGRNKERIFTYDIPRKALKVKIKDFYKNELYIVDAIGEATLYLEDKKYEKHYLYWIGTNDKIDMLGEIVTEVRSLAYKDYLDHFEKYHYKKVSFQENRNGTAEIIKEKIIK